MTDNDLQNPQKVEILKKLLDCPKTGKVRETNWNTKPANEMLEQIRNSK